MALSVAGAARYIPGVIWPVAGLVYFGPQVGLARRKMPVLAALAQGVHLLAAALVSGLALLVVLLQLSGNPGETSRAGLAGAVGLGLGLGAAVLWKLPRYLLPFLNRSGRGKSRAGENESVSLPEVASLNLWRPAGYSALFWILNGSRLWFLALAFGAASPAIIPYLIGAGAATTLLAVVFFFVPIGLGVVEVSLAWWLGLVLGWPQVVAIVALNRLMRTLNDFLFVGISSRNQFGRLEWQVRNLLKSKRS